MNLRLRNLILFLAMTFVPALTAAAPAAKETSSTPSAYDKALATARDRSAALRSAAASLRKSADDPAPANLTADETAEARKYEAWMRAAADRVVAISTNWEREVETLRSACEKDRSCSREAAAKTIGDANTRFDYQCQQLEEKAKSEQAQYDRISGILKEKADAVRKSIDNVR